MLLRFKFFQVATIHSKAENIGLRSLSHPRSASVFRGFKARYNLLTDIQIAHPSVRHVQHVDVATMGKSVLESYDSSASPCCPDVGFVHLTGQNEGQNPNTIMLSRSYQAWKSPDRPSKITKQTKIKSLCNGPNSWLRLVTMLTIYHLLWKDWK